MSQHADPDPHGPAASGHVAAAYLDAGAGPVYLVPGHRLTLGTAKSCDIVLDGPGIAAKHARVYLQCLTRTSEDGSAWPNCGGSMQAAIDSDKARDIGRDLREPGDPNKVARDHGDGQNWLGSVRKCLKSCGVRVEPS